MLTIVTYLWEDKTRHNRGYVCGPEHVVILKNMIERNCTVQHQFYCGVGPGVDLSHTDVETFEMDMTKHVPGTVYARLMQHDPDAWLWTNAHRVLSLDVDVVITGNIDHIVTRKEDAVFWRNPNFPSPQRAFYQSSVQLFVPGARTQLWSDFNPETQIIPDGYPFAGHHINHRFGGKEQAWISECLPWDEAYWDENDGIYGAGRLGGAGVGTSLPANACIVSFPGARAPWQEDVQEKHPWVGGHYR